MKFNILKMLIISACLLLTVDMNAQKKVTVSGYVKESGSGEPVIGAVVFTSDKATGVSTNEYGFYSLSLPTGKITLMASSIDFKIAEVTLDLSSSVKHDFVLEPDEVQLEAAKVFSKSRKDDLTLPQMGVQTVNTAIAKKMPALMGETDIIRVIQMMPGVSTPSEGSTGFSVRGGGLDQNLILMDGAPIYNSGHFLGFLSMFNSDVVKTTQLYKGDFPAKYGGKTASVLDVSTIDGNLNEFHGNLGVGLLTSKIFLEGPVSKSKASFMLAARRTYVDLFFPLLKDYISDKTKLSFYDINAKINWNLGEKDRLSLSAFSSDDVFGLSLEEMGVSLMTFDYSNNTQSLRWNHVFSPKLFSNLILYNSRYVSKMGADMSESPFDWQAVISEIGVKDSYTWYISPRSTMDFGAHAAYYTIRPNETHPRGESIVHDVVSPYTYAISPALYLSMEHKLGALTLRYGLRNSMFTTLGDTDQYYYDDVTHEKKISIHFDRWERIQTYFGLEPRASASFKVADNTSLKASYSRSFQYVQQAVMSVSGSIVDAWFTASPNVKPQISDQFSAGVTQNFCDDAFQFTVEAFYKNNKNTIDLKDNPGLVIVHNDREGLLRFGKSYAYGLEGMLEYDFDKINGWISYTYSHAMYDIPEINNGRPYRSPINHKHSFSAVLTYDISKKLSASADWVYYSGSPTTYPALRYKFGEAYVPVYSQRNADNMPDYHRLDLSVTLKGAKRQANRRWGGEWNFSVYNVYDRHNAWSITTGYNRLDNLMEARKVYIFSVLPSVAYNLNF